VTSGKPNLLYGGLYLSVIVIILIVCFTFLVMKDMGVSLAIERVMLIRSRHLSELRALIVVREPKVPIVRLKLGTMFVEGDRMTEMANSIIGSRERESTCGQSDRANCIPATQISFRGHGRVKNEHTTRPRIQSRHRQRKLS
jgi:hypothetical protein